MYRFAAFITCLITATTLAHASTIGFVGPVSTINDGTYYVLPYQLTIDGVSQLVDCYDILDGVSGGDVWQASLLTIDAAATSGFFSPADVLAQYEQIAWLSAQTYTDAAQEIGLQHAIWNVFGNVSNTAESEAYESAASSAAASGYAGFDFSTFRFIQEPGAVAGNPGVEQAFVYQVPGTVPEGGPSTPEPGTVLLLVSGLSLIVYRKRLAISRRRA